MFLHLFGAWAEMKLTLCEDPWPPYTIGEEGKAPRGGAAVTYLQHAFEQIEGLTLEMKLYPWKRCLNLVETGAVDGVILALHHEERAKFMEYSIPYYLSRLVFFYNREQYPEGLELNLDQVWSHYTVGHVAGFTFGEKFEQAVQDGVVFDVANRPELCLKKLLGKCFDLYFENEFSGKTVIHQLGYQEKIGMAIPALDEKM